VRDLVPQDLTGVTYVMLPGSGVSADGKLVIYGVNRHISDLYVTEGLRLE
jgi:hypothetical protein